jgi:recombination protein RecT
MWMKSAARQLRKWVPTSAEFLREMARATVAAGQVSQERDLPPAPAEAVDFIDGDVIDPDEAWLAAQEPPEGAGVPL